MSEENKNKKSNSTPSKKNSGSRETFSKKSHIGESKAQQDTLRKGSEIPPPKPKKK